MRRALAWLLVLPLVAVGLLAEHAAAYWIAVPHELERSRELASTGHGWLEHAPWLVALCVAVLAVACTAVAASARKATAPPRLSTAFALLPPVAFLAHEYVEHAVQAETLTPSLAPDRLLLVGLALQIPLGVAALCLARTLCAFSVTMGQALSARASRPAAPHRTLSLRMRPTGASLRRIPALASYHASRAPPATS